MINRVLGLNDEVLRQCPPAEQAAYRLASRFFLLAMLTAMMGNACFGWLLFRSLGGVLLLTVLISFIHFSVLRISLITLMSRPLTEDDNFQNNPALTVKRPRTFLFNNPLLKPVSLLRMLFVGCIAVSVSMPLASMFFYEEAVQTEQAYLDEFVSRHPGEVSSDKALIEDFMQAHYPFVIFRALIKKPACKFLFLIFCSLFFLPLFILSRLRHGRNFQYTVLLKDAMLREVMIDYDETMEQMQHYLNRHFPDYQLRLTEMNAFADGPLRHRLKRDANISFGDKKAFDDFLNSI